MTARNPIRMVLLTAAGCAVMATATVIPHTVAQAQQIPSAEPVRKGGLPDYLGMWFPKWFGKKDEGPRPEDTLQAPFAAPDTLAPAAQAPAQGDVIYTSSDGHRYRIYTGEDGRRYEMPDYTPGGSDEASGTLEQPHRRAEDIADWLVRATSEILTMDSNNYQRHLQHLATGMSEAGLAEFNKFMSDTNILAELQEQGMQLRGYVEETPLPLNEGAVAGRYRWLFEMPVTVTFIPRDARNYRNIADPRANSLQFIVQTQIGRVEKGPTDDNVVIETWRVRGNPRGQSSRPAAGAQ